METVEDILNQAKRLQPRERLQLTQELFLTLEPDDEVLSDSDWNAAWIPELEARVAAYERGESQASDWRDVIKTLRANFGDPRN